MITFEVVYLRSKLFKHRCIGFLQCISSIIPGSDHRIRLPPPPFCTKTHGRGHQHIWFVHPSTLLYARTMAVNTFSFKSCWVPSMDCSTKILSNKKSYTTVILKGLPQKFTLLHSFFAYFKQDAWKIYPYVL